MSKRLTRLHQYAEHPWLHRVYKKLNKAEMAVAVAFIEKNDGLDKGSFELAINRMFIEKPKSKHYREILELLTCANSSLNS